MFVVEHTAGSHTKDIIFNQTIIANASYWDCCTGGAVINFATDGDATDGDRFWLNR